MDSQAPTGALVLVSPRYREALDRIEILRMLHVVSDTVAAKVNRRLDDWGLVLTAILDAEDTSPSPTNAVKFLDAYQQREVAFDSVRDAFNNVEAEPLAPLTAPFPSDLQVLAERMAAKAHDEVLRMLAAILGQVPADKHDCAKCGPVLRAKCTLPKAVAWRAAQPVEVTSPEQPGPLPEVDTERFAELQDLAEVLHGKHE